MNALLGKSWLSSLLGYAIALLVAWQANIGGGMTWKTGLLAALIAILGRVTHDVSGNLSFIDRLVVNHGEAEMESALNKLLEASKSQDAAQSAKGATA